MNFNILICLIFAASCGVKGPPSAPKSAVAPSLIENYPDIKTNKPIDDKKTMSGQRRR